MPSRRIYSNAISETAVAFYDSGGHNHDGINSSLIDTSKYSLFDFNVNTVYSTNQRALAQERNLQSFKNLVISIVNNNILSPAGITLGENVINGFNIISRSITTNELSTDAIQSLNYIGPTSAIDFSTTGAFLKLDTGDIITPGLFANGTTGSLTINANITGGSIDIGGSDSSSFHVDTSGNMWLGSGSYSGAPFKISSSGVATLTQNVSSVDYSISIGANEVYFYNNTETVSSIVLDMSEYNNRLRPSTGIYFKDKSDPTLFSAIVAANNAGTHYLFLSSPNDDYSSIEEYSYLYIGSNGFELRGSDVLGHSSYVSGDSNDLRMYGWSTANITAPTSVIIGSTGGTGGPGNIYLTSPTVTANGNVSIGSNLVVNSNTTTSGITKISNGVTTAPSLCFTSDTNTGIFSPSADNLAISTGGVERLRIQDNGNMLFQTSGATLGLNPPTGSGSLCELVNAFGFYFIYRDTSLSGTKENIQEVGEWLVPDMVDQINPMLWNRKTAPGIPEIGPMAEDMEAISPFLVACGIDLDENGDIIKTLEGINIKSWVNLLTIGLQDARARIAYLEDLVEQLQGSN